MALTQDPNLDLLIRVAEALGELRGRFVFLGGCATGLLITDPAAPAARPTRDVIVEVGALAEYRELGRELQAKGFSQPLAAGDPPYRWTGRDGSKLDVTNLIHLPSRGKDMPDRDRLAMRFDLFRSRT